MKATTRYAVHKATAKRRGIEFKLTFEQWNNWWLNQGVDKNIDYGQKTSNTLCMCRRNDSGAYELSNIYVDTLSNNIKLSFNLRQANNTFRNHTSVPIQTPLGKFNTIKAGCEVLGVPRWTLEKMMETNPKEYYRVF